MKPFVDILGTRYKIEVHKYKDDVFLNKNHLDGYCSYPGKLIVIADMNEEYEMCSEVERRNYANHVLRHEIIHAFLDESGLGENANQWNDAWPKNEEMIDFFATQIPKIIEAYKWCECL